MLIKRSIIYIMTQHYIEPIKQKLSLAPPIGAVIAVDFGATGGLLIDGNTTPPKVTATDSVDASTVDTVLACDPAVFDGILNGTQDPTMAYMTGKLKVQGSMGYAMKLNSILED